MLIEERILADEKRLQIPFDDLGDRGVPRHAPSESAQALICRDLHNDVVAGVVPEVAHDDRARNGHVTGHRAHVDDLHGFTMSTADASNARATDAFRVVSRTERGSRAEHVRWRGIRARRCAPPG